MEMTNTVNYCYLDSTDVTHQTKVTLVTRFDLDVGFSILEDLVLINAEFRPVDYCHDLSQEDTVNFVIVCVNVQTY
jgi:hypothetical protein